MLDKEQVLAWGKFSHVEHASGASILCRILIEQGIRFIFGIPGTHNLEFYDCMNSHPELDPILITDEQSAGFMADGVYRASGHLAALSLVPGAGLCHALSGIAEAALDQVPMLVILCAPRSDSPYGFQLHDIDQLSLAAPLVKKVFRTQNHQDIYSFTRYSIQLALQAPRGPVALEVPAELFFAKGSYDPEWAYPVLSPLVALGELSHYECLRDKLHSCRQLGLYLGNGAAMPQEILIKLAERLDAIVFTTLSAKGIFPEDHPRFVWNGMGHALPASLKTLQEECDGILAIGCRFGEVATASYGFHFSGLLLHVDIDASVLQRNYQADASLVADGRAFVEKLLQDLPSEAPPPDIKRLERVAQGRGEVMLKREQASAQGGVNPYILLKKLQQTFGAEAIFVTDSGNGLFRAMEGLCLTKPACFLAPVDFSCMGYGIPASIGAALAMPKRPVIGLIGDGALLMTGLEMLTARRYGLGLLWIILEDQCYSQIAQFQEQTTGSTTQTELLTLDTDALAKTVGVQSLRCSETEDIGPCLERARELMTSGKSLLLTVPIAASETTYFTRGVLKANFTRLDWRDRFRVMGRLAQRKIHS